MSYEIEKQCLYCNSIDKQICINICTEKINDEYSLGFFCYFQCDDLKGIDLKLKVILLEMFDSLNKNKINCLSKDFKRFKTCE